MDSALPLLLFFAFLFGSTILVLVCGVMSREEERREEEAAERSPAAELLGAPAFLSRIGPAAATEPASDPDAAVVAALERHLASEREWIAGFVREPSHDGLWADGAEREDGGALVEGLERFLRGEQGAVRDFVSRPTLVGLYGGAAIAS